MNGHTFRPNESVLLYLEGRSNGCSGEKGRVNCSGCLGVPVVSWFGCLGCLSCSGRSSVCPLPPLPHPSCWSPRPSPTGSVGTTLCAGFGVVQVSKGGVLVLYVLHLYVTRVAGVTAAQPKHEKNDTA